VLSVGEYFATAFGQERPFIGTIEVPDSSHCAGLSVRGANNICGERGPAAITADAEG